MKKKRQVAATWHILSMAKPFGSTKEEDEKEGEREGRSNPQRRAAGISFQLSDSS
jgi:hypothetical protein